MRPAPNGNGFTASLDELIVNHFDEELSHRINELLIGFEGTVVVVTLSGVLGAIMANYVDNQEEFERFLPTALAVMTSSGTFTLGEGNAPSPINPS